MSKKHLRQPPTQAGTTGFAYSAFGPFTNKRKNNKA